ncbi:uncharacterized protein SOCEGT47_078180 [Sorangium cellulosum]|uniref:DUF2169 domain-containing protein n=1 Tax=Sorangium cellulosum TaxID=56 RepID=A0A4P2QC13_SORCE|nr:DUF2169 domain-containing protein [Sorangium cellulosum]AUX27235.1 uncharacterized protein SOCEGT47_078180 [Sorangium cellulosum]
MATTAIAPDRVLPLNGAAATAVAWRSRDQLRVTVIVKATFAFAADAVMPRVEPQKVLRGEVHHGGNPGRSVRLTSDLAPHLERADVLFTGHAHAPAPGTPVQSLPVRLAISDEGGPLLEKELVVQDRAGFQRMPIVYERAVRGENDQENFLGVPATGDPAEVEANVLDPREPARPAGFGPIARAWPARRRLLGSTPRKALDAPIAEIPDAFEWAYFQAAPPDQRMRYLRGDEWIELHGLHPTLPRLRTRLPEARGRARIHGLSSAGVSEGQPLDLNADTLRIDGDEQRCTLVFRGSFPVPDEAALAAVFVVAGVETADAPLDWPERPQERGAGAPEPGQGAGAPEPGRAEMVAGAARAVDALSATQAAPAAAAGTVSLPADGAATAAFALAAAVTPFRPGIALVDRGAAAAGPGAHGPQQDTGTIALPPDEEAAPGWRPSATLALLPEQDGRAADRPPLPFQPASPGEAGPLPSAGAREPGAAEERRDSGTLALTPEPADGAEAPPSAPEPPPLSSPSPAPEPPQRAVLSASPARSPEPDAPSAAPPPPRPPPAPERPALPTPSPALRRSLYERFDRKR